MNSDTKTTFGSETDAEGVMHPGLFAELQNLINQSGVAHHVDLQKGFGVENPVGEEGIGDALSEQHISHHELVDKKHHEVLLKLFQKLLTMPPEDLMLAYQVISRFEGKLSQLKEPGYFESKGIHTPEEAAHHRSNAEKLHSHVNQIRNDLREKILEKTGRIIGEEVGEDEFRQIMQERAAEQLGLKEIFQKKVPTLKSKHADRLQRHVSERVGSLHTKLADHKEDLEYDPGVEFSQDKINFIPASAELTARLNDSDLISPAIQEALKTTATRIFAGISDYALIGSTAVVLTSDDRRTRGISDVDCNFAEKDADAVMANLEALKSEGLVDSLKRTPVDKYGSGERFSGVIKVEFFDSVSGENLIQYVDFEFFAEAPSAGISQLGNLSRDIIQVPFGEKAEGESLNVMSVDGLVDQYVINFLAEFDLDATSDSAFALDSKDLGRLSVLNNRFDLEVLSGIITAIAETREKYLAHSQHPKLQRLLEKSRKVEAFLREQDDEFHRASPAGASLEFRKANQLKTLGALKDFMDQIHILRKHGLVLRKYLHHIDEIDDPAAMLKIFEQANKDSQDLASRIKKFQDNPLMHLAINRYVFGPLAKLAAKMETATEFPDDDVWAEESDSPVVSGEDIGKAA